MSLGVCTRQSRVCCRSAPRALWALAFDAKLYKSRWLVLGSSSSILYCAGSLSDVLPTSHRSRLALRVQSTLTCLYNEYHPASVTFIQLLSTNSFT